MSDTMSSDEGPGWRIALYATAILGVLLAVAAWFGFGVRAGIAVACGAGLGAGNLWTIGLVVRAFLGGAAARWPWVLVALAKFSALYGGVFLLVFCGVADILPLAVGLGALPLGIVVAQLGAPASSGPRD